MTFWQRIDPPALMASRWRRRRICELVAAGRPQHVVLRDISGGAAWIDTNSPPELGCDVELRHPIAGSVAGRVTGIVEHGARISFNQDEATIAFALCAIAADMTRD